MRLANRIAIVTGASRGLGPYVARALAAEHCSVVLAARSQPELETVAESVRAMGTKAITVKCDVAVAAGLAKGVLSLVLHLMADGSPRIAAAR